MTGVNFEPAVLCLAASLLWAPLVYLAATRLDRGRSLTASEMLWLTALGVAALPTLVAPALAAAGISLRPAPAEIPVAVMLEAARSLEPIGSAAAPIPEGPQITFATLINAISLLYIYGVLLAFGVWLTRSIFFALHVRRAMSIDHPQLIYALEIWRRRLGVEPRLEVRVSDAVSSVCVYGLFRPVIIVPSDLNARISFEDLVMMCAHELAHVKRGDCRLFAASAAARILFWFNPFVKRIAGRAELAAEQSADALVLNCGADRRAYAACFVEGLRYAAERAQVSRVAIPSFTPFDKKSRRDRLDAILSGEERPRRTPSKLAIAVAATLAGALAVAQAAIAVQPSEDATDEAVIAESIDGEALLDGASDPVIADAVADATMSLAYGAEIDGKAGDKRQKHGGVDIKAPLGAPVTAPYDGVVIDATDVYRGEPNWGKVVVIKHRDGMTTRYAHLDNYSVKKGDRVKAGDKIGEVGSTGKTTGPHLHFETLVDGKRVDPVTVADMASPVAPVVARSALAASTPAASAFAEPAFAAEPVEPTEPVNALDAIESVDLELAGAPQAPRPPVKREFKGFATMAPEAFLNFGSGDKGSILFKDGDSFAWELADGDDFNFAFDGEWSEEHRKELQNSLSSMRHKMAKAKEQHAAAMEQLRATMQGMELDGGDLSALSAMATAQASEAMKKFEKDRVRINKAAKEATKHSFNWEQWQGDQEQAKRDHKQAERDRQQALRDQQQARFDREQARRDEEQAQRDEEQAERDREQAEREAELEQERAEREAAWAERQDEFTRRESERQAERIERETERAQQLAEREAERAQLIAEREAERAQAEAEREAERAQAEAERMQEEAERIAEEAAQQAEYEAERAAREIELAQEQQENDRLQMLDLREQALAEAERALEQERAEIERLREEMDTDADTNIDANDDGGE